MWIRFINTTGVITVGSTVSGVVYGSYIGYSNSNDVLLPQNIATTCFCGFCGGIAGTFFGITWPIGISVGVARLLEYNKQNKN